MNISTLVYKNFLESKGIRKHIWSLVRKMLIKLFNDPTCTMPLHGRLLKLPLSHALPFNLEQHQQYDRLPGRISEYLHRKYKHLKCIDVGANIGDTVASFYKNEADLFLAIEPNPNYYKFLTANWNWNKNVKTLAVICSSGSGDGTFAVQERNGTASILEADTGNRMLKQTLDQIAHVYPDFSNPTVIKIDTDGHDFEVIKGAAKLISRNLPIVLFECDTFTNANYVEECINTLNLFKQSGYNSFLLYDNYGYLMGKFFLSDLSAFQNLLFYQLTSEFTYFDILIMKEEDIAVFFKTEIQYFAEEMPDKLLQKTAKAAIEF